MYGIPDGKIMNAIITAYWKSIRELLEKMIEDRIFSIGFYDGKFFVSEECDGYYSHTLTKKEAHELSELFHELENDIEE